MAEDTSTGRPASGLRGVLVPLALAQFMFQALVVVVIVALTLRIDDPLPVDRTRSFDVGGAVLSAVGLVLLVMGMVRGYNAIVVQSSFPDEEQGETSGLSRSVSNLGSSLDTAVAGTILVAGRTHYSYAALVVLAVIGVGGFVAAALLPRDRQPRTG